MKTFLLKTFFLLIFLLTACGQAPASTPTATPKPTHSATPTVTLTSQPSNTPTASPTPTVFPTLPVEQARARLLDLLATNGNCRLPCLWGITPGKTTPQEARAILEPLNSIAKANFRLDTGSTTPKFPDGLAAAVYLHFSYPDYQLIHSISFQTGVIKPINDGGLNPASFAKLTNYYRLHKILSEYGIPSGVAISTPGKPSAKNIGTGTFLLVLFYPKHGFLVNYTIHQQLINKNIRACPANAELQLESLPIDADFLVPVQGKYIWPIIPNDRFWRPLEKATSMSLEQFYETFREPTDKCIETPENLWYKPQR